MSKRRKQGFGLQQKRAVFEGRERMTALRRIKRELGVADDERAMRRTKLSLDRLRAICMSLQALAEKAAEDSTTLEERLELQKEADVLTDEYNEIVNNTDFEARLRVERVLDDLKNNRLH